MKFKDLIIVCKILAAGIMLAVAASCTGEDRSGEQPFKPTVRTLNVEVADQAVTVTGEIEASPNSSIRECGFEYWSDNLSAVKVLSDDSTSIFHATADSLEPGAYSCTAFARNGMGTSRGDTLSFNID